jgi:hypothetical protein
MKTKTKILFYLLLVPVLAILQRCDKYSDDSPFTLRSRNGRVANTWKVENYKINGSDYTSLVTGYSETYTKKGSYSYLWGNLYGSGTWKFQNKDEEIQLSGSDTQSSRRLFILKLEENSFWYYYMDGNDKHELHLTSY